MNRSSKYRSKLNILKTVLYCSKNWSFQLCFAPCTILTIETVIILLKISKNIHDLLVYSILKIMVQLHWQYSCSSRYCCHHRNRPLVQVKISGISSGRQWQRHNNNRKWCSWLCQLLRILQIIMGSAASSHRQKGSSLTVELFPGSKAGFTQQLN